MLVLLDRDGVLNEDRPDHVKNPGEFRMIEGAAQAVARLNTKGHKVALVTNQSGVGRGLYDTAMLDRIHDSLRAELRRAGGHLDAIFVCTDAPWNAGPRRKPEPGMLDEALRMFRTRAPEAVMIGDALRDLEAAAKIGVPRILVRTGKGTATQGAGLPPHVHPVAVYDNLARAVAALLNEDQDESESGA